MPFPWLLQPHADETQCHALAKATGVRCTQPAIKGANVCWIHGLGRRGTKPREAHERRMSEQAEQAALAAECAKLGIPKDVDPGPALLAMVREAAGNVEFYRMRAQELGSNVDDVEETEKSSKDVPHIRVRMYDAERDRLANCAQLALRAGVEERAVQLAEVEAARLLGSFATAIDAAGLTDDQAEIMRRVMSDALAVVPALGA